MTFQQNDHDELAEQNLSRADEWANRDNVDRETREHMVDYYLRVSAVHAQLATAQHLAAIADILETKVYPAIAEGV